MFEYTVHFQRGQRVGTRSLRMVTVNASSVKEAIRLAKDEFDAPGYYLNRVDHFDSNGRLVIDV